MGVAVGASRERLKWQLIIERSTASQFRQRGLRAARGRPIELARRVIEEASFTGDLSLGCSRSRTCADAVYEEPRGSRDRGIT